MNPSRAILVLALVGLAVLPTAAGPLKWAESMEPHGHIWPDGHTCAYVATTSDGFLAVRRAPAVSAALIGKLKTRAFVDVAACTTDACRAGTWREVTWNDPSAADYGAHPMRGWANARYLNQTACLDEP